MKICSVVRRLLVALIAWSVAAAAASEDFPTKPISVVSPFAAGGAVDIIARLLAPKLSSDLGVPVIVNNKVGGGGMVGSEFVAHSTPDGYTVMVQGTTPFAINVAAKREFGFDPQRDLVPVAMITSMTNVVAVTPSLPVHNIADLVSYAKANRGKVNYGMSGIGNLSHFNAEMFAAFAGIAIVGVPYKGASPMITDLVAGRVHVSFDNLAPVLPFVKSGAVRALAVTSLRRSTFLPDIPTLDELGFSGFDNAAWFAVFAPARTPQPVVAKLHQSLIKALGNAEVTAALAKSGVEPAPGDGNTVARQLRNDIAKFAKIISDANIKIE